MMFNGAHSTVKETLFLNAVERFDASSGYRFSQGIHILLIGYRILNRLPGRGTGCLIQTPYFYCRGIAQYIYACLRD
jgi:hypothetical protein